MRYEQIALKKLVPHPDNPTRDTGIKELALSISGVGLMHPLHVMPLDEAEDCREGEEQGYYVIAGCRRLAALNHPLSGYHPNDEVECVVREGDIDVEMIRYSENEQRIDVHPLDQAEHAIALVHGTHKPMKGAVELIANQIGESPYRLRQLMELDRLPDEVKKLYREERLTWGHVRLLVQVQDPKEQVAFADDWAGGDWNGPIPLDRCRKALLEESKLLSKAPWKLDDGELPGGACSECPNNTGRDDDVLFEELADKARCSNASCYEEKGKTWQDVRLIQLEQCGEKVMSHAEAGKREKEYKRNGWVPLSMSLGRFNNGAPTKGRTTLKTLVGKEVKPWTYIPLDDFSVEPHARRMEIEKTLLAKNLTTNAELGYTDDYKPGQVSLKDEKAVSKEKAAERRAKQNQKVITEMADKMQQHVEVLEPDAFHAVMSFALAELVSCVDPLAMNKYGKAHEMKLTEGESPSRSAWSPLLAKRLESGSTTEQITMLLELVLFGCWPAKFRPELRDEVKKIAELVGIDLKPIIALSKEKPIRKKKS